MSASVVTVTLNPTVDKTFAVECLIPERKLEGKDVKDYPGGGGVNVARAVTRLGRHAAAFWSCGGNTGQRLERLLTDEGVDTHPVPVTNETRENYIVYDHSSEQQYRFGMPGPTFVANDLERWVLTLRDLTHAQPDYLVFSGSLPPGVTAQWFTSLLALVPRSTKLIVDTKRDALTCAVRRGVFLIKPNVRELEEISEVRIQDDETIERAARHLMRDGSVEVVLVSLGRGGAMLVTADEARRIASPPVPVRSKVGAGDSMVGGVVTALANGWSILDAARLGVAAGAAAVMRPGTDLCRREDTERLYARIS